jgi:carbamate kinase
LWLWPDGEAGALLARRLNVDLFLLLTDGAPSSVPAKEEAARRIVEVTGHRAAIGEIEKAVEIVRGADGIPGLRLARDATHGGQTFGSTHNYESARRPPSG